MKQRDTVELLDRLAHERDEARAGALVVVGALVLLLLLAMLVACGPAPTGDDESFDAEAPTSTAPPGPS